MGIGTRCRYQSPLTIPPLQRLDRYTQQLCRLADARGIFHGESYTLLRIFCDTRVKLPSKGVFDSTVTAQPTRTTPRE